MLEVGYPDLDQVYSDIRQWAIAYASGGFNVMRLWGVVPGPDGDLKCACSRKLCTKPGQHRNNGGPRRLVPSSDPEIVGQWWDEYPFSNVGLLAAGRFGLVVDLEPPKYFGRLSGSQYWDKLVTKRGPVPETLTFETPSGSRRLVFDELADRDRRETPISTKVRNTPRVVVRRHEKLLVAPPSLDPSGRVYRTITNLKPASPPDWLYMQSPNPRGGLDYVL